MFNYQSTEWLFSLDGMFSEKGQEVHDLFVLEPPKPIKRSMYHCDSIFHVEHITRLYETYNAYGVIQINGQNTVFFGFNGEELTKIGAYGTRLQKNHDMGGQSQNRIERLRQECIREYLKKINEKALSLYLTSEGLSIKGLILVGSGLKKEQLYKEILDSRLKNVCLGVITSEQMPIPALTALVRGEDRKALNEKWDVFTDCVRDDPDRLCFGPKEVNEMLKSGMLQYVFSTEVHRTLTDQCQSIGCTLIHIPNEYGICGIKWY